MDCAGVVDAYRAGHLVLGSLLQDVVVGPLRCWGSGLGRVHVEKEAIALDDEGARIAGGKRLAKALAGHSALCVSMLGGCVDVGEVGQVCTANFPMMMLQMSWRLWRSAALRVSKRANDECR